MKRISGNTFPVFALLLTVVIGNAAIIQAKSLDQQFLAEPILLFSDDFDRGDSSTVGNGWEEIETSGAVTGIQANRLCFTDTSDAALRPIVQHTFQKVSNGELLWQFDFDWARQFRENSYQLLMQLGEGALMSDGNPNAGVGVNLVWMQIGGVHETLAYRQGGVDTPLLVLSGAASLAIRTNLESQKYELIIGGMSIKPDIPFDNPVNLDTVRFLTDGLNEVYFSSRCFDNLVIQSAAPLPTATNTLTTSPLPTATGIPTATQTPEITTTATDTPLPTPTTTATATWTATDTPLPTHTATLTLTAMASPTPTASATATPTATAMPSATPTATAVDGMLFSDAFERADSSVVGNSWEEVEATGANAGIQGNRLCFLDTSDVLNRPLVRHVFPLVSGGVLTWEFDFDWVRTGNEGSYRLFMQLGQGGLLSDSIQDGGVGVNLVWTNVGGVHQTLGYRLNGVTTGLRVVSGFARVRVEANLDADTYAIYINNALIQAGIPFEEAVSLDTVRLFTDGLNEINFGARCFDNLTIVQGSNTGTAPSIFSEPVTAGSLWQAYSYDVNASGSPSPTYALVDAPAGMTINQANGLITWTPGLTGVFQVTVQAANTAGSDSQQFTLVISATPQFTCAAPVRIMPLGDSITVGKSSGVDDVTRQISYRKDLWESLLAANRSIDFVGSLVNGEFYPGFDPQHEGHSGWTDAQIAFNIYDNGGANWLNLNPPDVILLHIGTNALNPDPADVQNILNEIDQYEAANNRRVIVVLARIIDWVPNNATVHQFNDNVQAMAQARIENGDRVILVDMEDGAGLIYSLQPAGDMWNSLHPFATGYTKMASVWYDALDEILPACP